MKAEMGDIVIVVGVHAGGGANQPAIVTQVFEPLASDSNVDARVNLTVFADQMAPCLRTSIAYYSSLMIANVRGAKMPFCYPKK